MVSQSGMIVSRQIIVRSKLIIPVPHKLNIFYPKLLLWLLYLFWLTLHYSHLSHGWPLLVSELIGERGNLCLNCTGKINLSTFTSTSSRIPLGKAIDMSAIYREIDVNVRSLVINLLRMDEGMRLILGPRSHTTFSIVWPPIEHGIVKLPGSFSFSDNFLWMIALHYSDRLIVTCPSIFIFLVMISSIN